MLFNGRQDGKVVVIWKPETLTIHSYSTDDGKTWTPIKPKPLKENNEFENMWVVYKKTGKCPQLTFDVFESFFDWLLHKYMTPPHSNPNPIINFLKNDRNFVNLHKLIRKDTKKNLSVRFQLIHALEPIDLWDFFLEYYNTSIKAYDFAERLMSLLDKHLVPDDLCEEIKIELSKGSYGWVGERILGHITGDHPTI